MCKVSVIMPLFNANKYIYKTIHSILNQTYPDFELIIIDDKSLDNSVDIVNSIKDKRIKLYMNEKIWELLIQETGHWIYVMENILQLWMMMILHQITDLKMK